jgi:hypothetical protein
VFWRDAIDRVSPFSNESVTRQLPHPQGDGVIDGEFYKLGGLHSIKILLDSFDFAEIEELQHH